VTTGTVEPIDYVHARNTHSATGPAAALPVILQAIGGRPRSLVDVGCGTGTWLRAARECGIDDLLGIEGVVAPADQLQVDAVCIRRGDLTRPLELGRRFDVALCLEVGEHLDEAVSATLVASLAEVSDVVVFSAACPDQPGQHHVNCQWPAYWQRLFNTQGFACSDAVRWRLWEIEAVEPWYRQNMFIARRDPAAAGTEPRIAPCLHPAMLAETIMLQGPVQRGRAAQLREIAGGSMAASWYLVTAARALRAKVGRAIHAATGPRAS
jgi:hypothetical protein